MAVFMDPEMLGGAWKAPVRKKTSQDLWTLVGSSFHSRYISSTYTALSDRRKQRKTTMPISLDNGGIGVYLLPRIQCAEGS